MRIRTSLRLLVLSALWLWTDGDIDASCVVMETCILPCSFRGGAEAVVYWILLAEKNIYVHSYNQNQDRLTDQDQRFTSRTSLFRDQISRGNASLQLTGVQVQDQGRYECETSTADGNKETFINLRVDAPVRKVHIEQVGNRLSCRSEGIYPEPGLTWSTNPPSNRALDTTATVQQNEQLLYNISSSLVLDDGGSDVVYSCTISTRRNRKRVRFKLSFISGSSREPSVLCTWLNISLTDFSLVWTFNHNQVILKWNNGSYTVSEKWRRHVKSVSESGSLTLKQLTPDQGGIYSCELSGDEETYISNTSIKKHKGRQTSVSLIVTGVVVGVVLVAGLAAGLFRYNKYKKTQTEQSQGQAVALSTVQKREEIEEMFEK